jgi:hypothetical protein
VDFFELSDLTVDCNGPGHTAPYGIFPAPVTCGAVILGGNFTALSRVRVINFCTLGLSGGAFMAIEDCIVEKPGENNTHETTLLTSVTGAYGATGQRKSQLRHAPG